MMDFWGNCVDEDFDVVMCVILLFVGLMCEDLDAFASRVFVSFDVVGAR